MKRALGYLLFGALAIGAVYVSVNRISPFLSAQESGDGVADAATTAAEPPTTAPTLMPSPTIVPPTAFPPTLAPSPTLIPPTETLVPNPVPVTEVIVPAQSLPTEALAPTSTPAIASVTAEVTATVEGIVSAEVLPPSEPVVGAAALSDLSPTVIATRDGSSASTPMSNGGQLSLGTPIVQPPPTLMPEMIQPTIVPGDTQPAPVTTMASTVETSPVLAQITGMISAPLAANLVLTLPDGTTINATTAQDGSFTFSNLLPGTYRLQASADGFLTSQVEFSLSDGQSLALPPAALRGGDTNRDNVIDVRDAVLIAANFGGPAIAPETDLNRDGLIDIRDLTILGAVFGQSGPTPWG